MGGKKKHDRQKKIRDDDEIQEAETQSKHIQHQQIDKHQEDTPDDNQPQFQLIPPKKVSYCPACSFPFQLCKFGKNPNLCIKVLYDLAPAKVVKYHPNFKQQDISTITQQIKQSKKEESLKQQIKQKTIKDKYVVIDTKSRGKHKHVTTISGLNIYNIDAKDFSKKCSKKFACSCSAIEEGVAQIQGEFFEEIKQILIMEHKVKKKYIIDGEEYKHKFNEQMMKKKQEKKLKNKEIKQVDEKDEDDQIKQKNQKPSEGDELAKVQEKPKNRLGFEIRSDSEDDDQ